MTEWEQITHSSQPEVFFGLPRGDSIVMAMSLTNICFRLIESGLIVEETPAAGIITQYENYSRRFLEHGQPVDGHPFCRPCFPETQSGLKRFLPRRRKIIFKV